MNPIQISGNWSQQKQFLPVLATEQYGSALYGFCDYDFSK